MYINIVCEITVHTVTCDKNGQLYFMCEILTLVHESLNNQER
jgi:hypothetical protein